MSSILLLISVGLSLPSIVSANTCYDAYYGYYDCGGLSNGARIGIGIAIAVGILFVISLFGYLRRKRLLKSWRAHQAQQAASLPQYQNPTTAYGSDVQPGSQQPNAQGYYGPQSTMQQYPSYAPPPGAPPFNSSANGGYGYGNSAGVKVPQNSYQPGYNSTTSGNGDIGVGMGEVHGYEYQQEMENRRREEESAATAAAAGGGGGGGGVAPPGYEMATSTPTPGVGEAASYYNSQPVVSSNNRKGGMAV